MFQKQKSAKKSAGIYTVLIILALSSLFFSTELLAQWLPANGPYGPKVLAFASDGNTTFAGTNGTGVFYYNDNTSYWRAANNGLVNDTVLSLVYSQPNLMAGTNRGVYLSTDMGGQLDGCY